MTEWLMLGQQVGASPIMKQMFMFHDHTLMIMLMILTTVSYMMVMLMKNKNMSRFMLEGEMIEMTWTITPGVILIFSAITSLRLFYLMDKVHTPALTLKVLGHQLYWSYEYSDFTKLET